MTIEFTEDFVARVYAQPGKQPALGPSALRMAGGRIAQISALADLPASARHHIALPALANAHDHGRGLRTLAFGAQDQALETWLTELAYEPRIDPYLRAVVAFARMVESGICAANHCHNTQDGRQLLAEAEAVSRAARDVGLRIAFAVPFAGRNSVVYGPLEPLLKQLPATDHARIQAMRRPSRSLQENMQLVEQIAALEHEFFSVQYGPVGPQWLDDGALLAIAKASAADGRRVHMHLFETRHQRDWADAHYKYGLIQHLDNMGLLSPRLTIAHAVWLTLDECRLLAERGVTVSANLSSNMRLRSGVPAWRHYLDAGLKFGIGLDGMSCDDDEDMLRELRLAWRHLGTQCSANEFNTADLFESACVTGRYSITGDDGGGRMLAGAPADFIVLDTQRLYSDVLDPTRSDELNLILARASKRDIQRVVIAGRTVAQDGKCVTVDLPALEARLLDEARQAMHAAPVDAAAVARLRDAVAHYYAHEALHCVCSDTDDIAD
jgi:5-methylthioadenosine/S-adenosylhomocysteine deaminase